MSKILILGANSDIALACAEKFASERHDIVLASRSQTPILKNITSQYNVKTEWIYFNGSEIESHEVFFKPLEGKIDTVILCFGYLGDQVLALEDPKERQLLNHTNFGGAVSILSLVGQDFIKRKAGIIIAISSVAGDRGRRSNYYYGSAKAGLTSFLSGFRSYCYVNNVHVSTIKPGFVKTKMTAHLTLPQALTVSPEKVASTIYSKAFVKKKNVVYVKWIWRYIMWVIRIIPEVIFKRLNF